MSKKKTVVTTEAQVWRLMDEAFAGMAIGLPWRGSALAYFREIEHSTNKYVTVRVTVFHTLEFRHTIDVKDGKIDVSEAVLKLRSELLAHILSYEFRQGQESVRAPIRSALGL